MQPGEAARESRTLPDSKKKTPNRYWVFSFCPVSMSHSPGAAQNQNFSSPFRLYSYGVLSNGSMIDDALIALLKETDVAFDHPSMDGRREIHDALRAPDDYERTPNMARLRERNGIPTHISFIANKENYRDLPMVAWECRKRGVSCLWSDRLVPIG